MTQILGKDGTQWRKEPPKISKARPHNILLKLPGVVGQDAKNAKTEFECWNLFFSNFILNLLVQLYKISTIIYKTFEKNLKEKEIAGLQT